MASFEEMNKSIQTMMKSQLQMAKLKEPGGGKTYSTAGSAGGGGGGYQFEDIDHAETIVRQLDEAIHELKQQAQDIRDATANLQQPFSQDPVSKDFGNKGGLSLQKMAQMNHSMHEYTTWLKKNLTDAMAKYKAQEQANADSLKEQ